VQLINSTQIIIIIFEHDPPAPSYVCPIMAQDKTFRHSISRVLAFTTTHEKPGTLPHYYAVCQDRVDAAICSGIMLKNNDTYMAQVS